MVTEAGRVEALLTLNASGFDRSISSSIDKVKNFVSTMEKLSDNSTKFTQGIREVTTQLKNLGTVIDRVANNDAFTKFKTMSEGMQNMVRAAIEFNRAGGVTSQTFRIMGNSIQAFMNSLGGVQVKLTNVVKTQEQVVQSSNQVITAETRMKANLGTGYDKYLSKINEVNDALMRMRANLGSGYGNYLSNINQVQSSLNSTGKSANTASESTKKMSNATESAGNSAKNAQGSFRGLSNVLSTLRGIGMMVVSMFAYNFLHSLGQTVSETIKARSEMYSLFSTMGMTTSGVNLFNNALDQTVAKFQRVNKYSLGETVASIGVEFNLSAKEMAKAMDVTSMITSEYLRAGRNASEASLAVRDIMQGQFQRLSRETGVKQKDLEAAGWDGDTKNVLGLMEALEKVAYSRNWDTFAAKANSLNDIVLITQNRFGEWAADISEYIVPVVTGAFNILVTIISSLSSILGGVATALQLPDWAGAAVLVGGFVASLVALVPALITARTGLGLMDIAERGLKDSIVGAIFGIKAEEAANVSSTKVLAAKILGLNLEEVSQNGVKGALIKKLGIENVEAAMQQRTISLILAKILGLNMEKVAEEGVLAAIGRKIAAQIAEILHLNEARVAEMGHTAAVVAGTLAITAMVVVIGLLVAGFMALIAPILNATASMEKFNKLVKEGNNLIKDANETKTKFAKQYENATKKLSKLTKGTEEYNAALREQAQAKKNVNDMTEKYIPNLQKAVYLAGAAQQNYDDGKVKSMVNAERELNDEFIKLGINSQIAGEMASTAMAEAREGQKILYTALQRFNYDLAKHNLGTIALTATLKRSGKEDKEIQDVVDGYTTAWENMEKNRQTRMTSDNFGDIVNASLGEAYFSASLWWTEFNAYLQAGANDIAWEKFWKGIAHGFADLPMLHDFWGWVFKESGMLEYKGKGWDGLGQFFADSLGKILNPIETAFNAADWLRAQFGFEKGKGVLFDTTELEASFMESMNNFFTSIYNWSPMGGGFVISDWLKKQLGVSSDKGLLFDADFQAKLWGELTNLGNTVRQGFNNVVSIIRYTVSQWVNAGLNGARQLFTSIGSVVSQISPKIGSEFAKIPDRIRAAIPAAVSAAKSYGVSILEAALGAMGIKSPGIVQNKITAEFQNTVSNIGDTVESARSVGADFGSAITGAVTDNLTGGFIMDYRGDAGQINAINQSITSDTASTFTDLGLTVDGTISTMSSNIATNYTNMNMTQSTMLNGMATQNKTAFNNIQTQTNTSLKNMRDSTSNVTLQMTRAWSTMKDNIVASANQLKTQSTAHFNTLSAHIGTFYRKLQNPSMWGAGDKVPTRYYNSARGNRGRTAVRRHFGLGGGFAGGVGQANLPRTMSLKRLRQMMGDSPIFDGLDLNQVVDVVTFLSNFDGGFGWNTWHSKHFNKIKTTTGDYNMKSPQIMHRINTSATFHPKEFYNGRPSVSFGQFQSMAESLFSAIPYDFYYNSDKYGSWVNALNAGACNCYDGASALIALASTCGFGGYMASGTWNGIPHVYAVINGRKMDTTGWQQRRNWNGVSAGGDVKGVGQTTVNITVDMSNSNIYGVDELDSRIENGVNKAMQKSINPSKIIGY